jgi:chromosome segregation ATPase
MLRLVIRCKVAAVPPTYPLAVLHESRQSAVEDTEKDLAERATEYERAELRLRQANECLTAARARILSQVQALADRAKLGQVLASELQAGAAFRISAQSQITELEREVSRAQSAAQECQAALSRARELATLARQELAIVQRHRQNFLAKLRRTEELVAEEEAAEVSQAHRSTPPPVGSRW